MIYEYAGFKYEVVPTDKGTISVTALPGQHPAAGKARHLQAALSCYLDDQKRGVKNGQC